MATQPQTVAASAKAGDNSKALLQAAIDKAREFGELAGAGDGSKVALYLDLGERSHNNEIDKTAGEPIYDAFFEARQKRAGMARAGKGKDRGVRISEIKRIIIMCGLPNINGPKVLDTAVRIIRDNPQIKGEVDDKLLKIARVQCSSPDKPLTAEEIKHYLQPPEKEDKAEADRLGPVANAINKIAKDVGWDGHKRAAFASINARIEQLGGTSKQKREKDRAAKKKAGANGKKKV